MSKEKKMHTIIERQCPEEKARMWNRLEGELPQELTCELTSECAEVKPRRAVRWRKFLPACASCLAALAMVILIPLGVSGTAMKNGGMDDMVDGGDEIDAPTASDDGEEPKGDSPDEVTVSDAADDGNRLIYLLPVCITLSVIFVGGVAATAVLCCRDREKKE